MWKNMQKNILCFGDSNTHGYNSKTGGRFDVNERWTKLYRKIWGMITISLKKDSAEEPLPLRIRFSRDCVA